MPNEPLKQEPITVLVVESDSSLRPLFVAVLSRLGFRIDCAADADEALALFGRASHAVVIFDLVLPLQDGLQALERFASAGPMLRRTIVTTCISDRLLTNLDRSRVHAVLAKPFEVETLAATVRACASASQDLEQWAPERRPRMRTGMKADLDGSIRKFESALPEVRQLLASTINSDRELMLQRQLREVVSDLSGVISAVASIQQDATRAERYAALGRKASTIAGGRVSPSAREH